MTQTLETSVQQLINAVNEADSAVKLLQAVQKLAAAQSPEAIPTLIQVLGFNNPGAAVAATEGLINLGEIAIAPLMKNLDDYNYGARAWALRVFAGIGDIRALDLLISAATTDFSLSVRRAATKGLGNIQLSSLPPEDIAPTQEKIFRTLCLTIQDGEWVVRYASIVALENLTQSLKAFNNNYLIPQIVEQLTLLSQKDDEIGVQTRAKLALTKIKQEV
ncbi:HEAT repeat domain-containing protein [Cyanobacterium aponinum UTEX 3222]|uniref:HEAT domain containing protein n=2 Tax=Cyanobacterium aponinum TaxID=379064 RepID=K9Z6R9_CYAAP|nr:HEAT repeat domain-containing protein [Cyanobacterium aponinum]AFZ54250.1 HEAT domain containing protein [Cyanobacterium aponinum PCC 10605]MBD2393857.1 HEAT repeat domain-containing protein [Cyanobacterium aponinum FACHB-4101]MTF39604.1 HEAT repeat domain-containing protein [Cyanobacterium aponinum 0216]WRL43795.1 HEAT repeat domain-containing protein [Cyanobacterium aponinum UTEX 3222]